MLLRRRIGLLIFGRASRWFAAIGLVVLFVGGAGTTSAQPAASVSFAGKTMTIINSNAVGGSADLEARLYARFLPAFLPGRPTVIVRDMPGATDTIAWDYVYRTAKPDGLTVCACTNLVVPVVVHPGKRDMTRYTWIGGIPFPSVLFIKRSVVAKPEALLHAKGIVYGGTGTASTSDLGVRLALKALGVPYRYVLGFHGNAPIKQAMLSHVVNAAMMSLPAYHTLGFAQMVRSGSMLAVAQSGLLDSDGKILADKRIALPTLSSLVEKLRPKAFDATIHNATRIVVGARTLIRGIALPPDTSAPIADAVRSSFTDMFADAKFKAAYHKLTGVAPDLIEGTRAQRVVMNIAKLAKAEPQAVALLRKLAGSR